MFSFFALLKARHFIASAKLFLFASNASRSLNKENEDVAEQEELGDILNGIL